jgi:3-phosphoshikimate 1-carboxyvinyltransferase
MEYVVEPVSSLSGEASAPPSKSYTIRALLSSLLAEGKSKINSPLASRDTQAAFNATELFGGKISYFDDCVDVDGTGGRVINPGHIDTLNSGTTIRIATAIASLCPAEVELTGDESIQKRPIQPLLNALSQLGVKSHSTKGNPPHRVKGPLLGGNCKIAGNISSQYITALAMAAPYAREDVVVDITTPLKSRPYLDLTLNMLKRYGIACKNEDYQRLTIPSGQVYQSTEYTVEGDFSSAAFILSAAALVKSEVMVKNLFKDSLQADKRITSILSDMGAKVIARKDAVTVKSDGVLSGITVDLSDSPDLVPIVSVLGSLAEGETKIVNAEHARLKECDRIHAMATELRKMGADIAETKDGLVMRKSRLIGTTVEGWTDHRVIMSLAVAAARASGATKITGAEHVDVTFPQFKGVMNALGARIKQTT